MVDAGEYFLREDFGVFHDINFAEAKVTCVAIV
jgi:hypothetical protein